MKMSREVINLIEDFISYHSGFNISAIEFDSGELVIYFQDSLEPWSIREFVKQSPLRQALEELQYSIEQYA
jgi:hypothetical protein